MTAPSFVDMPGFVHGNSNVDDHNMQVGASLSGGAVSAQAVLKVAWVIIIACLIGLWLMGYSFKTGR